MESQNRKWADPALRLAGVLLMGAALLVGRRLFGAADARARAEPLSYLLALVGMACASTGAALAVWGHHLFDRVELSERWTVHQAPRRRR